MEYGDFEITISVEDAEFRARVRRIDKRHFTITGSNHPHLLLGYAETAETYATEAEAVENGKLIADSARP